MGTYYINFGVSDLFVSEGRTGHSFWKVESAWRTKQVANIRAKDTMLIPRQMWCEYELHNMNSGNESFLKGSLALSMLQEAVLIKNILATQLDILMTFCSGLANPTAKNITLTESRKHCTKTIASLQTTNAPRVATLSSKLQVQCLFIHWEGQPRNNKAYLGV